jgi:hypothetical protein
MPHPVSVLRRLSAVLAGAMLVAAATAAAAQASYGEIGRFGGVRGAGAGQFEAKEAAAIGVDPENNSVFVVDLPDENNEFRIQKFEDIGGKYKVVATARFKPKDDELKEEEFDTVDGVAIDTKLKRLYVLSNEIRSAKKATIDVEDEAASELYAFSTEQVGETLEPAVPGDEEGLLASQKVLKTLSNKQGEALLEPNGIAVDPANDDVIILGKEENAQHEELTALEQVTDTGTLGSRWVDNEDYFEGEANSPAVSANGSIYVDDGFGHELGVSEIAEIPSSFNDAVGPKALPGTVFSEATEKLAVFPGNPETLYGGSLSIGPEGTIDTRASIAQQIEGQPEFAYQGVVEFNEKGEEEGWTGGQSAASGGGKCTISETPAAEIAAGSDHDVFVYSDALEEPTIIEFGPGGSGCPTGSAATPVASVNNQPILEEEQIPIADQVTLSSTLRQANALSVEWKFGDGTEKTVSTRQGQKTEVTHQFVEAGPLTMTEKIHTDNLQTPELVVTRKIKIQPPVAVTGTRAEVEPSATKTSAKLVGTVNPEGVPVSECYFEYGTSTAYGSTAACVGTLGSGTSPVAVSASLPTLTEGTLYDYRLVAKYAGGVSEGSNQTLSTQPEPVVVTSASAPIGQTTATLNASVTPGGVAVTKCEFLYGTSTSYGASAPCSSLPGAGTSAVPVSASLTGLTANTTYHFKIVASNAGWTSEGKDEKFTTAAAPPPPPPPPPPPSPGPEPGTGGVLPSIVVNPPAVPDATLASNSTTVSASGSFTLKVSCPAGETSCAGTLTLKTLTAVVASTAHAAKGKKKATILTLATGAFSVPGGQVKTVTLHLSSQARALLARTHSVTARVTIVAHDTAGATHATIVNVTLKAAKAAAKHH